VKTTRATRDDTEDQMNPEPLEKRRSRRRARARAAVMVEYAFLLLTVAIPTVVGLAGAGRVVIRQYKATRDHILSPFP
jgi:hypothetical protein